MNSRMVKVTVRSGAAEHVLMARPGKKLLDVLTRTQATLNRLMDENGTFIFADAAEAKKAKQPMNEQAEKLIARQG